MAKVILALSRCKREKVASQGVAEAIQFPSVEFTGCLPATYRYNVIIRSICAMWAIWDDVRPSVHAHVNLYTIQLPWPHTASVLTYRCARMCHARSESGDSEDRK